MRDRQLVTQVLILTASVITSGYKDRERKLIAGIDANLSRKHASRGEAWHEIGEIARLQMGTNNTSEETDGLVSEVGPLTVPPFQMTSEV